MRRNDKKAKLFDQQLTSVLPSNNIKSTIDSTTIHQAKIPVKIVYTLKVEHKIHNIRNLEKASGIYKI